MIKLETWVFIVTTLATPAPSHTQLYIGKIFATNIVRDDFSQFILQSFLKPTIRYELKHGDMLMFGDHYVPSTAKTQKQKLDQGLWLKSAVL